MLCGLFVVTAAGAMCPPSLHAHVSACFFRAVHRRLRAQDDLDALFNSVTPTVAPTRTRSPVQAPAPDEFSVTRPSGLRATRNDIAPRASSSSRVTAAAAPVSLPDASPSSRVALTRSSDTAHRVSSRGQTTSATDGAHRVSPSRIATAATSSNAAPRVSSRTPIVLAATAGTRTSSVRASTTAATRSPEVNSCTPATTRFHFCCFIVMAAHIVVGPTKFSHSQLALRATMQGGLSPAEETAADIRRDSNMAALQRRLRMSQARAAARAESRTVR